jgi:hypothetical protein
LSLLSLLVACACARRGQFLSANQILRKAISETTKKSIADHVSTNQRPPFSEKWQAKFGLGPVSKKINTPHSMNRL